MNECPACGTHKRQVKNGMNVSGTQRYKCRECGRVYTPEPKMAGYEAQVRQQAVKLYVDGMNLRRIARTLGVNHQSVANWVNAYATNLPAAPVPSQPEVIEVDELFTFVASKKSQLT